MEKKYTYKIAEFEDHTEYESSMGNECDFINCPVFIPSFTTSAETSLLAFLDSPFIELVAILEHTGGQGTGKEEYYKILYKDYRGNREERHKRLKRTIISQ